MVIPIEHGMNISSAYEPYSGARSRKIGILRPATLLWRWRNLSRPLLPPGMVALPFQKYPTLRYFWNIDAGLSSSWVRMAYLCFAIMAALDVLASYYPLRAAAIRLDQNVLALWRVAALPLYMLLMAMAVSSRCRWWKSGGRLEELLVTPLESRHLLPLLWVPAATKILGLYSLGFLFHLLLAANFPSTLHQSAFGFFASSVPGNLIMALFEFLLALLLMRAAITCSLFGSIRHAGAIGATAHGFLRAIEYVFLAGMGAIVPVMASAVLFLMAWGIESQLFFHLALVVSTMALISLLHNLALDTLEDYDQFQRDWRKWVVRK